MFYGAVIMHCKYRCILVAERLLVLPAVSSDCIFLLQPEIFLFLYHFIYFLSTSSYKTINLWAFLSCSYLMNYYNNNNNKMPIRLAVPVPYFWCEGAFLGGLLQAPPPPPPEALFHAPSLLGGACCRPGLLYSVHSQLCLSHRRVRSV